VRFAPGAPIEIVADRTLAKALLHNLLDNALKFSRPDSAPVEVSLEAAGDSVVLRVADDGIGIPAGREEDLLEPFVKLDPARGHHSGYGLGLDLCRRIVELHGGTIELRRRSPRGTEAVVSLPRNGG
jgi:signal transduction histidine kinase